jgi:pimeloyl-ACP methyl ester carboxylesterase
MNDFPDAAVWRAACVADPVLAAWRGPWPTDFAIDTGGAVFTTSEAAPRFTFAAPAETWAEYLRPVPRRHHHSLFAMLARLPGVRVEGDALAFHQQAHVLRRTLEIGKWLAQGHAVPMPVSLRPTLGAAFLPAAAGRYVPVTARGVPCAIYVEEAGAGRDILCLHTAGADGRQFHRLMADERITRGHRLVAFDLPWHGKSPPPAGAAPGSWRLDTELYIELIMNFVAAAGLSRPIVLGASMSGEICLELALRFPDTFAAIVACEACEKVDRRLNDWSVNPAVNAGFFIPEWIEGLMAPQSPAECAAEVLWHYAQSGPAVFYGDICFYSGDWDARDRVAHIDARRANLFMLTGEYDYSCTAEMSAATAAKIPGVRFQTMTGIGHFPFAENPAGFTDYLLPILNDIDEG